MGRLCGAEDRRGEPFASAEDAWFWTCSALHARHQGSRGEARGVRRPCDPDDLILCVERLLRTGQIATEHAQVLGRWGRRGVCPGRGCGEARDRTSWSQAMVTLGAVLRKKGIVDHAS